MGEPAIALVFTADPWVEHLHRHFTDHGGVRIRQVVVDPALAVDESYDTLVVSHRWPALSAGLVAELHDRGRRVLGVYDRTEPAGRDMLLGVGVDALIESDAAPGDFREALEALAPGEGTVRRDVDDSGPGAEPDDGFLAIGGPPGAGTTEVAIGLAGALATAGAPCALVDADDVGPCLATRLALSVEPCLHTAVAAVEHGDGGLAECLQRHRGGGFDVLAGLPDVAGWEHVRPGEVLRVLRALERRYATVIVDTGGIVEDVAHRGRGRFATTRSVLAAAGAVVGVAAASPVGVVRLIGWAATLRSLAPDAPLWVVLDRAPADRYRRAELVAEVLDALDPVGVVLAPVDRRVEVAAWDGAVPTRGPFTAAVRALASDVAATVRGRSGAAA